jgi:hypothetical protein
MQIKDQKYTNISDMLIKNFLKEIKNWVFLILTYF